MTFAATIEQPLERPASETTQWVNWVGVVCFFATLAAGLWFGLNKVLLFGGLLAAYALPIALHEIMRHRKTMLPAFREGWVARTVTRTLAHYFTFAVLALLAWALPWYQANFLDGIFAAVDWRYAIAAGLLLVFFTPFYLMLVDHDPDMPGEPLDGGMALGDWMTGKHTDVRLRAAIQQHVLAWAVKFFFIPVMLGLAWASVEEFSNWDWPVAGIAALPLDEARDFVRETAIYLMGFLDVTIALVGYLCTMKLLNSHIRSTDTSGFGWLVCILCYGPWWLMFYQTYVAYDDDSYWQDWLADMPDILTWIWGGLIVFFTLTYVWATIAFGIRFSNLTNRGIITDGPYRFVKHPAYLSKNIFFWLISVPFVVVDTMPEAVRLSLLLVLVNILYYFRARTEERHLRNDPNYVAYEQWLSRHGLWATLRRLVRPKL